MITVLAQAPDTALNSELVKTLVNYFYQENLLIIKKYCFAPFVCYFISIATHSSYFMITEDKDKWTGFEVFETANWLIAVGFTLYFCSIEVRQMIHKGTKYFTGFTNFIDLASILLNLLLLASHYIKYLEKTTIIELSFVTIIFMWFNFIYWFRIFESTTFYFDLISQTIVDMSTFFVIFILIVYACGNSLYILNANRDSDDALYEEYFTEGLGFMNAILN